MMIIPTPVGPYSYDLFVVLGKDNLDRIQRYDPCQIVTGSLPDQFVEAKVRNIFITFATADELKLLAKMLALGHVTPALRFLTRGYMYRGGEEDQSGGYPPIEDESEENSHADEH
jgi:hypothetical protein